MGTEKPAAHEPAPGPDEQLAEKLEALQGELEAILRERRELEAQIDDLKQRVGSLQAEHSDVCEAEGRLRGQIGALEQAIRALER